MMITLTYFYHVVQYDCHMDTLVIYENYIEWQHMYVHS